MRATTSRRGFLRTTAATAAGLTMASTLPRNVLGANDRIRIGLIGCGGRGTYLLDQVLGLASGMNLEIAALCDVWRPALDQTVAALASRQARAPQTFSRYEDLLSVDDLNAVIIATPDFAHTPILIEATRRGLDAFVEKPLATVLDHAVEAMALVKAQGTIVQIGVQRRSDPRHQAGAELIRSGVLGTVSEVEAAWHDVNPRWARPYDDVRQADVDWDQYLMFLPKEPFSARRYRQWHLFKDFTSGTPTLLGSHLIDVAIWFMDDPLPASAVAHGGVYVWKDGREHADTIDCVIEYPKGFIVNYSTRLGNDNPVPEVAFYGTRGTFDTESWTARGDGGRDGDRITEPITVERPAPPGTDRTNGGPSPEGQGAAAQLDPRIEGDGHVRNWLECLRSRETPNAPIEVGYAHSVAGIMCLKAWETGRRQRYDAGQMAIVEG